MADFFVEFEIRNDQQYKRVALAFTALRSAKQEDDWHNDEYWLAFFDEQERSYFWWPTVAEIEDWNKRWFSTPVPERFTDPTLITPWGFSSMIEAFKNGDYELLTCERVSENIGQLTFNPYGWPYGGTGCMRALLESFGHLVTMEPES